MKPQCALEPIVIEATEERNHTVHNAEREQKEQRNKEYPSQALCARTLRSIEKPEHWPKQQAAPKHQESEWK